MNDVEIKNAKVVEDALEWGPAMRKLSPMRRAFVLALVADPKDDASAAAIAAGYSGNKASAARVGHRLRHDPGVLQAIHETAMASISSQKVLAAHTTREAMLDHSVAMRDRLRAAAMVMDRSGMPAQSEVRVEGTVKVEGIAEQIADILKLCKLTKQDPRPLLGPHGWTKAHELGLVIEGEFEEVPAEPPSAAPRQIAADAGQQERAAEAGRAAYRAFEAQWREMTGGVMADWRTSKGIRGRSGDPAAVWTAARNGTDRIEINVDGFGWMAAHGGTDTPIPAGAPDHSAFRAAVAQGEQAIARGDHLPRSGIAHGVNFDVT